MKILAPSDEDLNEPFPSGKTPYEYALEHKSVELIKILAPKIKNPNARYSPGRWIPIWRAIELGHNEIVEILAPLVENPNKSNSRCTNICVATGRGNIEAVKILAPLVKNPNFCGCGCTPICKATQHGNIEIVKFLAPFVENPNNCRPKCASPIFKAIELGNIEMVKFLASLVGNLKAVKNSAGDTPIQIAAKFGHWEIVKILVFEEIKGKIQRCF